MTDIQLHKEIDALPETLRKEVADFVEFVKFKAETLIKKDKPKIREAGTLKGMFGELPDDFDEPLEDFKDYM